MRTLYSMDCARCGNPLHKVPMYDLPNKVKEFACMCCGERFWTVEGNVDLFRNQHEVLAALKGQKAIQVELSSARKN